MSRVAQMNCTLPSACLSATAWNTNTRVIMNPAFLKESSQPRASSGRLDVCDGLPIAIVRIAPRHVEWMEQLREGQALGFANELRLAELMLKNARELVSRELHRVIGDCRNQNDRRALIETRRRLYNGQSLSSDQKGQLDATRDARLFDHLSDAAAALARVDQSRGTYASAYTNAQANERAWLSTLIHDESLEKGLILSSSTLHRALTAADVHSRRTASRSAQVERGLLRYLTRMVMKATPFGTFCHVLPVRLSRCGEDRRAHLVGDVECGVSIARLNKKLYGALWLALRKRPKVRAALRVRAAPTLRKTGNTYTALVAIAGRETFQRVQASPLLDAVFAVVAGDVERTVEQVADFLETGQVNAARGEIVAYVDRLIEIGVLQVCAVVGEQDPNWDSPLCSLLESTDDEVALRVARSVRELRIELNRYCAGTAAERADVLARMRTLVTSMLADVALDVQVSEVPLFEDATAPAHCNMPVGPKLADAFRTALALCAGLSRLSSSRVEHATMRRFWDEHYAVGASVPLLEFYHDYYRLSKKERIRPNGVSTTPSESLDPYSLELVRQMKAAAAKIRTLAKEAWAKDPSSNEISLSCDAILDALAIVPPTRDEGASIAAFMQLVWVGNRPRVVMKRWAAYTGYGKYFSRFLDVLPPEVLADIRSRNNQKSNPAPVEISGDAFFNANLHPWLLKGSIAYPTSDTIAPADALVVDDLVVVPSDDDDISLCVKERGTGRSIRPIDLGFLISEARAPLFQLLSALGNAPDGAFDWPTSLHPESDSEPVVGPLLAVADKQTTVTTAPTIEYRPRIVLADTLVVARRRWRIPSQVLPHRQRGEADSAFFHRLNSWRLAEGIPVEGYVTVAPARTSGRDPTPPVELETSDDQVVDDVRPGPDIDGNDTAGSRENTSRVEPIATAAKAREARPPASPPKLISPDAGKPQYIHFGSPALVGLFEHLPGALTPFILEIAERYPADDGLISSERGHHSFEFVFQFDGAGQVDGLDGWRTQ